MRKGKAAATGSIALGVGLPTGFLRGEFDDGTRARIFHMSQAEFHRVYARRQRRFVHKGFQRENIGVSPQRAQRRRAHGHVRQVMQQYILARKIIQRYSVTICCARRLRRIVGCGGWRWIGEVPAAQYKTARRIAGGACRMRVAPNFVLPTYDIFGFIELRLHFHDHGRTVRLPCELVVAHPLQFDRAAMGGAR